MKIASQHSISISPFKNGSPPKRARPPHQEGVLYGKTGICYAWKQLYLKANGENLDIDEDSKTNERTSLNLGDYDITWHGKLQDKFTIVLKSTSDSHGNLRWLYLGADDEASARNWYKYFNNVVKDLPPKKPPTNLGRQDEETWSTGKSRGRSVQVGNSNNKNNSPWSSNMKRSPNENKNNVREYIEQDMVDTGVEEDYSGEGGDFMLPEEAPEWVQGLYDRYIANNAIWKEVGESIPRGGQWEIMASEVGKTSMQIGNLVSDRQVFRCEYSFRRVSAQMIVKALLDVDKKRDWDSNVESINVLLYAPSTKQSILQQFNRNQGMFQLKREYVYMRYIFQTQNTYFIVDKSRGDEEGPLGISKEIAYKGYISYSIMRITEKDDRAYLTHLIKMTNGGLLTVAQDSKMTLTSLINTRQVEKVLALYEDEDDGDLMLIPCPRREEKVRWKQMMANKSNKKSPNRNARINGFHIQLGNINKEAHMQPNTSNRSKSMLRTYRTEEENLQEEDIDEKILLLSKNRKQDMWEIDISTSSKQASPDYLNAYNRSLI